MLNYNLVCEACGSKFGHESGIYKCSSCGGSLRVEHIFPDDSSYLADIIKDSNSMSMWDYRELIPVKSEKIITMGEGKTPLVDGTNLAKRLNINRAYIKNETLNPSGTFKDRCMTVSMSKALELNAPAVILGSAGNAASSAAAYAARAGLPCYVLVPMVTPLERVVQTMLYGGRVVLVDGTVNDCIDMIQDVHKEYGWHNVTTACVHNPYQAEGPKTISYEMGKQLEWDVPDWILVPMGGGGILSAIWKGYKDMYKLGLIKKLPKMVGMQATGCAAVVKTFKENKKPSEMVSWGKPNTIAAAIADPYPLDGMTALGSIYESKGYSDWVTDEEILNGQKTLAQCEGIFAEPASSTTVAGLIKLRGAGIIGENDTAVCVVTGTGLKDPKLAARNISDPPRVSKDTRSLIEAIKTYE